MQRACCVVLAGALALAVVGGVLSLPMAVKQVDEGHAGVLFFGGAAVGVLQPGFHWTIPHLNTIEQFPLTMQTEVVRGVPCGSSSGVEMSFKRVEVVWKVSNMQGVLELVKEHGRGWRELWIRDQVRTHVSQLCSHHSVAELFIHLFASMDDTIASQLNGVLRTWAPQLSIMSVRTTKPQLPPTLADKYSEVERTRAHLTVVKQQQATQVRAAMGEARREVMEAERQLDISRINASRRLETLASQASIADIDNAMWLSRAKQYADASYDRSIRAAEDEAKLLSPAYLQYLRSTVMLGNTKAYFGTSIPRVLVEGGSSQTADARLLRQATAPEG